MPMAKQARQIWTEKLGLLHLFPFTGVIFREIGHLATIPIFWSNQCKKSTNYKTRIDGILIILYRRHTKKHTPPKAAAIRLTLLLFPMCTKPRARYQNSEPPNHRSRLASRSNCTHLKEISPL